MEPEQYSRILSSLGGHWQPLTQRQRWRALDEWRKVYAAPLHRATGEWKLPQFEWHVFSYKHSPALKGARALAAYGAEKSASIYVVPEDEAYESGLSTGGCLPDFTGLYADVYIWPPSLEWRFAAY